MCRNMSLSEPPIGGSKGQMLRSGDVLGKLRNGVLMFLGQLACWLGIKGC